MSSGKPEVVIDNGSYNIKAGFACDNHPVTIFRNVVGRPSYLNGSYGKKPYDVYVGDKAVEWMEDYEMSYPVGVGGKIVHWDNMERIWHTIFYSQLKVAPEDRDVILACSPSALMGEKIKCCEVFFETLNIPGLCIQPQSVLALYGSGLTTGICVDLGYDSVDINPVFEGRQLSYAHIRTGLAGGQVSSYILNQLNERGYKLGPRSQQILEYIKSKLYVTQDLKVSKRDRHIYKLSNGESIEVSSEIFLAAEMLFQPALVLNQRTDYESLQVSVVKSALKCDSELQNHLFEAIVPCGGLAEIPGINERLATEIENEAQRKATLLTSSEPCTVAWLGGAIFAGLDSKRTWITKRQYEEYGDKVIRNKFF